MTIKALVCLFSTLCALTPLWAHEFWFSPAAGPFVAGNSARLSLRVGEYFEGDVVGFSTSRTLDLRHYDVNGSIDLRALLPRDISTPTLLVPLPVAGTQMVIFNSQPSVINLPADRFHAYLHDEGLDFIKDQREAAGNAGKAGRERYRRFVKTLIRVTTGANNASSQAMQIFLS
jgi:hypothetical protein